MTCKINKCRRRRSDSVTILNLWHDVAQAAWIPRKESRGTSSNATTTTTKANWCNWKKEEKTLKRTPRDNDQQAHTRIHTYKYKRLHITVPQRGALPRELPRKAAMTLHGCMYVYKCVSCNKQQWQWQRQHLQLGVQMRGMNIRFGERNKLIKGTNRYANLSYSFNKSTYICNSGMRPRNNNKCSNNSGNKKSNATTQQPNCGSGKSCANRALNITVRWGVAETRGACQRCIDPTKCDVA